MTILYIVVDKPKDWKPFYPSERVLSFDDYLRSPAEGDRGGVRVINLCRSRKYLSRGYYCSLLAEARGHKVLPSTDTLNDLRSKQLYVLEVEDLAQRIRASTESVDQGGADEFVVFSFFGHTGNVAVRALARELFERFPCPILRIRFRREGQWRLAELTPMAPTELDDDRQTLFAEELERFSHKVWRRPRKRRRYRYDIAILVDPDEALPPSNAGALRRFVRAGRDLRLDVDLIRRRDFNRLEEYDGLFIRATTAVNGYTYRFARRAEAAGMAVIDDPRSILRCTNKVYLADALQRRRVPTPEIRLLTRGSPEEELRARSADLGLPLVLKIPDGSFSRGVVRVDSAAEFRPALDKLFGHSAIVLAQEYLYTEFDWRIGVLAGRPLYACKYFMVRHHWQIYRHRGGQTASGGFETVPIAAVPKPVLRAALDACRVIGDGLYGVDIKQSGDRVAVIEVNDNPNIDAGVEDVHLGLELYRQVLGRLLARIEDLRGTNADASAPRNKVPVDLDGNAIR